MNQEHLIEKVSKALEPKFKVIIGDIPAKYIQENKSSQYVAIESNGDIYIDWNYSDFNVDTLKDEMERLLSHRDRDMDPITAGEFTYIAQRISSVL